jgi:hypothetical protein
MATGSKEMKMRIMEEGGFSNRAPLNQRNISAYLDNERRAFGTRGKAIKAEERRASHSDFIEALPDMQFSRSLHGLLNGNPTEVNMEYVLRHIDQYEKSTGDGVSVIDISVPYKD